MLQDELIELANRVCQLKAEVQIVEVFQIGIDFRYNKCYNLDEKNVIKEKAPCKISFSKSGTG